MLKKRIAATIIINNGIVVQSIGFRKFLPIGKPDIALEYLNSWGIDEIILLDMTATFSNKPPDFDMIRKASSKCFVPLTVGGGISKISDIQELMHCGADKISVNQATLVNPLLISEAANLFGSQCIVASIDVLQTSQGYRVYDYLNKKVVEFKPADFAKRLENLGAGEILINSVDKDGSYSGFDYDLVQEICENVKIPVIAAGGAKNALCFVDVFSKTKASAASAANFFHFTEHSVVTTKSIVSKSINIRNENKAQYSETCFDNNFRLQKKSDHDLEQMLFIKMEKEII
jgi:cyclase